MSKQYISSSHVVYSIRLHFVFVTKYRHKIITPEIEQELRVAFKEILNGWGSELIECGIEMDHAHLLVDIPPTIGISKLANNLKSASSKRIRGKFSSWVDKFYWKPYFWHRAYFVASVGHASLDTIKAYVEKQTTFGKDSRLDPPPNR
ncbi:MAG: IS200/IS605 family transposase [Pseudomonadota bacterium]